MTTGGHQVPGHGSGDDGFEEEGYDESQRAEILEATGDGPTDGLIMTDLAPDIGPDDDDLEMEDSELGDDDDEDESDEGDDDEDDVQADLDDDDIDEDSLSDADDAALRP